MESRPTRRRSDPESREIELMALVVDDESSSCTYVASLMRNLGIRSVTETHPANAVRVAESQAFDLAVIDLRMAPVDGMELIAQLRRAPWGADMYCILLTAADDPSTRVQALRGGFDDVVSKSVSAPELNAKLLAARRIVARQRKLDLALTELRTVANQDPLTGLFNRRFLFEELERTLTRGRSSVGLVLFDLNDFKIVNDTHGHLVGDRVLRDVASVLMRETRQQDLLARYGGDEFVLVLESSSVEEATAVADRIARQVASLSWEAEGDCIRISLTHGASSSSLLEEPTVNSLIEACDRDLYKNKFLGKKGAAFDYRYEPKPDARVHPMRLAPVLSRKWREQKA